MKFSAGTVWEQAIIEQLITAQVILLLVSPDFMASDYCYSVEMHRALERREQGGVIIRYRLAENYYAPDLAHAP